MKATIGRWAPALSLFAGLDGLEEASPCELFHNNRDGTFTSVAHESGVDFVGFVKGYRVREDASAAVEVVRPSFKIKTVRSPTR